TIHTAQSKGWDTLSNGALWDAAEEAGFDVLLTTDRRIRYQQNLQARRIALVVLTGSTRWSRVRQHADYRCRRCGHDSWQLFRNRHPHSSRGRAGVDNLPLLRADSVQPHR